LASRRVAEVELLGACPELPFALSGNRGGPPLFLLLQVTLKERSAREREGKSGSEQERKKENERARERARYRVIPEHRNRRDVFDHLACF